MKRKIIYTALALLCAAFAVTAQAMAPVGRVEISNVDVKYIDGKVEVSMLMDAEDTGLRRGEAVELTPVIKSGAHRRELPSIVFSGRHRTKSDSRAERFGTRVIPYDTGSALAPAAVVYDEVVAFEPWMAGAEVVLEENVYGCASNNTASGYSNLATLKAAPQKPAVTPVVMYIVPVAETVKNRDMTGTALVDFPVSKSTLLTSFGNNAQELDKIRRMIHDLTNDDAVVIKSATLRGFASPEGNYAFNERLAQNRAKSILRYLQKEYPAFANITTVSSVAEDWDGLKLVVEESHLSGRNAMLNIINSNDNPDTKERKLKALGDYPELLKNYFPQLRRTEYRIFYTVRSFTTEESVAIIKTSPERLSLDEMYVVANTYPRSSDEYGRAFETAVREFPQDPVANINYAAMLLERGRTAEARRYLEKHSSHPDALNNLGVVYMLEGDYAKARTYLERAASGPEVRHNLDLLTRLEKYEQEMKAFKSK